jgi:hypothetical protein
MPGSCKGRTSAKLGVAREGDRASETRGPVV